MTNGLQEQECNPTASTKKKEQEQNREHGAARGMQDTVAKAPLFLDTLAEKGNLC